MGDPGLGFPDSSVGKESACNTGDPSLIPQLGRCAAEGVGYPLQYSWASLVAQLVKNPPAMLETWFDPWVGEIPWRRERLPTPVFFPRESHGQRSLVGYSPWGHKELDATEWLTVSHFPDRDGHASLQEDGMSSRGCEGSSPCPVSCSCLVSGHFLSLSWFSRTLPSLLGGERGGTLPVSF